MSVPDVLEALLFAADRPVPLERLATAAEVSVAATRESLEALREEKASVGALQLVEVAGGWQFVTKPAFAPAIRRLRDEKKSRLSRAAFEVLAIVAYRQPVTRGDIDALRGVDSSAPLQFLLERKLIAPGKRKDAPGRPWLFETTPQFLEQFGLGALDDLPALEEFAFNEKPVHLFERGQVNVDESEGEGLLKEV
jgi:segregation and condensation protein B